MANNIQAAKKYIPVLDKIYKTGSLSSVLDGNPELAREGANAGELLVAKMVVDGLGDYDRTNGYPKGDVTLTWETIKADYDRGRMFTVDNVDNQDSADLAFGQLSDEFIRTQVVPEIDAMRFAKYATTAITATNNKEETLTDGQAVIKALREAANKMDEAEVPENRVLFITPTLKGMLDDLDTNKSREVLSKFTNVVSVPQARFFTEIELKEKGFDKKSDAKDINFLIVAQDATIQYPKHQAPKVVTPELNQDADAWKFGYRIVNVTQVYENKTAGVYVSTKAAL